MFIAGGRRQAFVLFNDVDTGIRALLLCDQAKFGQWPIRLSFSSKRPSEVHDVELPPVSAVGMGSVPVPVALPAPSSLPTPVSVPFADPLDSRDSYSTAE